MGLFEQLAQKKEAVVTAWFSIVANSYPAETARFLSNQKDPFANPVGQTTHKSLVELIQQLDRELDAKAAQAALDPILRIRAIQDFTPARAVGFVFDLKNILHKTLKIDHTTYDEMRILEQRIDSLALMAFDVFMHCREKIFDLKANEVKQRTYKAFAKAGLIKELTDDE